MDSSCAFQNKMLKPDHHYNTSQLRFCLLYPISEGLEVGGVRSELSREASVLSSAALYAALYSKYLKMSVCGEQRLFDGR